MNKNADIKSLKGIGDKIEALYHKVGIYTYGDLMYYYPRDYIRYDAPVQAAENMEGKFVFINVRVESRPLLRRAG